MYLGLDIGTSSVKAVLVDADQKMIGLVKKVQVGIVGDAGAAAMALLQRIEGKTLVCDASRDERAATMSSP